MTVYQTTQPDNSFLYWYLLNSNGHSYYYSSPTFVTNYTSLPMSPIPPVGMKQAVETGEKVEQLELPPSQEPAVVEAEISQERISELQAEEAAEIAAEQHADEAAEAMPVTPTQDSGSTGRAEPQETPSQESTPSESPSTSSESSSSDSGSSGGGGDD